jgi:hypothetical protein
MALVRVRARVNTRSHQYRRHRLLEHTCGGRARGWQRDAIAFAGEA